MGQEAWWPEMVSTRPLLGYGGHGAKETGARERMSGDATVARKGAGERESTMERASGDRS